MASTLIAMASNLLAVEIPFDDCWNQEFFGVSKTTGWVHRHQTSPGEEPEESCDVGERTAAPP